MLQNGLYEVEQIIGKQVINRRVLYRVRWKGFSSDHDSWEPSANLGACRLLLKKYNEEHDTEPECHVTGGSKRSHPGDSSPGDGQKAPKAKKQKLSKNDLRQKLDSRKSKISSECLQGKDEDSVNKPLNEIIQGGSGGKLKKKNKPVRPKKSDLLQSKINKLKKLNLKPKQKLNQVTLVVNENGEVAKKFKKTKGDSVTVKQKEIVNKSKDGNKILKATKEGSGSPKLTQSCIHELLKRQSQSGNSSEQSKQRIEKLKQLLELQKHQCGTSTNTANSLSGDSSKQPKPKGHGGASSSVKQISKVDGKTTTTSDGRDVQVVVGAGAGTTTPVKNAESETVDLTKSPSDVAVFLTSAESIEISDDEEDEDDGEDVLYSLNPDCDLKSKSKGGSSGDGVGKNKKDSACSKSSSVIEISDGAGAKSTGTKTKDGGAGSLSKAKKKKGMMSLMDSKQKDKFWTEKSGEELIRPASPPPPPPPFTTVKEHSGSPDANPDPSKPSGPDPVSPEASETYLADVPTSYGVTSSQSVLEDEDPHHHHQPLSPGSMSYKSFLLNLPDQLQQGVKRVAKKGGKANNSTARSVFSVLGNPVSSTTISSSSSPSPSSSVLGLGGAVERRASVRSSECAFRYKQIVVKKCYHFTQIWLHTHTAMKNALNPTVIQEIISAMNSAKYDDSHLVLFSGFGPVFCSGTDLHYLLTGDRRQAARQMTERIRELTKTFISFPKPIIAAVSGAAVGLGVSLLLLCDVVYASDKASFHLPYSQLSQTPEGCSSFTLPQSLGLPSSNELLFGGRKITAMEAYQLGLVSQVFWPTLMMQEVIPRAQKMALSSAKALEATKLLIRSHHRTKMELTNETECNLLLERWLSVDCQHAIEAYIANEKNWLL